MVDTAALSTATPAIAWDDFPDELKSAICYYLDASVVAVALDARPARASVPVFPACAPMHFDLNGHVHLQQISRHFVPENVCAFSGAACLDTLEILSCAPNKRLETVSLRFVDLSASHVAACRRILAHATRVKLTLALDARCSVSRAMSLLDCINVDSVSLEIQGYLHSPQLIGALCALLRKMRHLLNFEFLIPDNVEPEDAFSSYETVQQTVLDLCRERLSRSELLICGLYVPGNHLHWLPLLFDVALQEGSGPFDLPLRLMPEALVGRGFRYADLIKTMPFLDFSTIVTDATSAQCAFSEMYRTESYHSALLSNIQPMVTHLPDLRPYIDWMLVTLKQRSQIDTLAGQLDSLHTAQPTAFERFDKALADAVASETIPDSLPVFRLLDNVRLELRQTWDAVSSYLLSEAQRLLDNPLTADCAEQLMKYPFYSLGDRDSVFVAPCASEQCVRNMQQWLKLIAQIQDKTDNLYLLPFPYRVERVKVVKAVDAT